MTREKACEKAQIIDFQGGYTIALVTEIFNDHETAIEILMKANEEEISRHFNECEKYEAQLKAKDKKIENLEELIRRYESDE